VLALLGHDEQGRQTLDAPILIRTAEISPDGRLRVPVGATLVRHSTAAGEVAETHAKAAGILAALGVRPAARRPAGREPVDTPVVRAALAARNTSLARFWLDERRPGALEIPELTGRTAVIVDGEDTFTAMLAHQLRALGLSVSVVPWHSPGDLLEDLVVVGPGPGDPTAQRDPKMAALRTLVAGRLATGRPTFAVCLGHQILAALLGLPLHRRRTPYQGLARDIDLFGSRRRVGYYSSFTARSDVDVLATAYGPVEIARDCDDGTVHALRGRGFAGVQFHPESVLSRDGMAVLSTLLAALLADVISPARTG
jgi:phenazine biosynthesis protein phzE